MNNPGSKHQTGGVSRVLQILTTFGIEEGDEQGVEFFFDTDCELRVKSLSAQLTQLGTRFMVYMSSVVSIPSPVVRLRLK